MKTAFKMFGLLWISHHAYAGVIYGVDQIQTQYQQAHYPVYVQMGSFSTSHAAEQLKHNLDAGTKAPVMIQSSRGRYNVSVGPFHNKAALKAFAHHTIQDSHQTPLKKQAHTNSLQAPVHEKITAYAVQPGSHPEVSAFLGGSYIPNAIHGQTLQLMPYEIDQYADRFSNQTGSTAFTWGVDALYRFKLHDASAEHYFFDSIGAGINVFQITNFNQTGNVAQFNLPEFENYTYALNLNNIRVMANVDLDFHPVQHHFTPFIQAGIGGARTAISYRSTPISPVDGPNFTLPTEASWSFAYQAGAGIKYAANPHAVLSLRYLYANMGKVNSSTLGSTTNLATPLTANMSTQNILFGLTYLIN